MAKVENLKEKNVYYTYKKRLPTKNKSPLCCSIQTTKFPKYFSTRSEHENNSFEMKLKNEQF